MTKSDVENFKKELQKLYEQYHIFVTGCGCCGSPWLESSEPVSARQRLDYAPIQFDRKKEHYVIL